jgi:hypothetical protein
MFLAVDAPLLELVYIMLAQDVNEQGLGAMCLRFARLHTILGPVLDAIPLAEFVQGSAPPGLLQRMLTFFTEHVDWSSDASQKFLPRLMTATSLWEHGASKRAMLEFLCDKLLPPSFHVGNSISFSVAGAAAHMWKLGREKALGVCFETLKRDRLAMIELLTTELDIDDMGYMTGFLAWADKRGAFDGLGVWAKMCIPADDMFHHVLTHTTASAVPTLIPFWQRSGLLTPQALADLLIADDTFEELCDLENFDDNLDDIDRPEAERLLMCLRAMPSPELVAGLVQLACRYGQGPPAIQQFQLLLDQLRGVWTTPGVLHATLLCLIATPTLHRPILELLRVHVDFGVLTASEREEVSTFAQSTQRAHPERCWWDVLRGSLREAAGGAGAAGEAADGAGVGMKRRRPF